MAGIYSQGGSAGHRYAGWLSEVEAKNFQFGGKVFNGSPSAIYVGSNLVWLGLGYEAKQAILGAFGQMDGMAVIKATNAYLNQLAASGQAGKDKATALAGFINEDPMLVCSLGLEVEGVTMPWRILEIKDGAYVETNLYGIMTIKVDAKFDQSTNSWIGFVGCSNSNNWVGQMNGKIAQSDSSPWIMTISSTVRHQLTIQFLSNKKIITAENGETNTRDSGSRDLTATYWLGRVRNHNGYLNNSYGHAEFISPNNEELANFIPMKLGKAWAAEDVSTGVAQAAGTCGMIDLVSGKFFPNANSSGSFTIPDISYTPSTP